MRENRSNEAIQTFNQLLKLNRKDVESLLKIGIIHLQQKNYDDAIKEFTHLLKEEPHYTRRCTTWQLHMKKNRIMNRRSGISASLPRPVRSGMRLNRGWPWYS